MQEYTFVFYFNEGGYYKCWACGLVYAISALEQQYPGIDYDNDVSHYTKY